MQRDRVNSEAAVWAAVCVDYRSTRRLASAYGLDSRWTTLAQDTMNGSVRLSDWTQFMAEIETCIQAEEDLDTRTGDGAISNIRPLLPPSPSEGEYSCPRRLCNRRSPMAPLSEPPNCALFSTSMINE